MTSKRIAQSDRQQKSEKSQVSGILQRAAVRSDSDGGVQSTDDLALSNSAFSKDFSQVPISTTKPQQIMTKLMIGSAGNKYEREADRVAAQVVKQINAPASAQSTQGQSVQCQDAAQEELQTKPSISVLQRSQLPTQVQLEAKAEDEELQTKSIIQRREAIGGAEASTDLESAINSARGGGMPLEDGLQQSMGVAMGADFSRVKVHTDTRADQLNQSIQAKAFTTGQDVFFRQGAYEPGSRGGQELIAHELTHVVQQNGGAVQRSPLILEPYQQYAALDESAQLEAITHTQGTDLIQRKIIARIRTTKTTWGTREISEIRLEGRAPTDAPGSSQGDHTIAETLINESVKREIFGQTPQVALNNIMVLARLTLLEPNVQELNNKINMEWENFSTKEGEDQNKVVEDVIQKYIEMANKRPGTAFLRDQDVTRGGGGERQHINLVRNLANKLEQKQEITEKDLTDAADSLTGLIDMKYVEGHEQRYMDLVIRALDHAVFSIFPQLGTMFEKYRRGLIFWLMTKLKQRDNIPEDMFNGYMSTLESKYRFSL